MKTKISLLLAVIILFKPNPIPSAALLSSSNNNLNSKSGKGNLAERRSDRGRVLRQAENLFSFFLLCHEFAATRKLGIAEKRY